MKFQDFTTDEFTMDEVKDKIINELTCTYRSGIGYLLDYMYDNGFYEAPCSGAYHLAENGGLARHSLDVLNVAEELYTLLGGSDTGIDRKSIVICALLHDLGKIGQYGKPNYVPKMVRSKKKNPDTGEYDMVQSDATPYVTNSELMYVDHEIRSISIASRFIELSEDEQFAILYHNGMYGNLKYALSGKETPLYMIIHWADMWASRVLESNRKAGV